MSKMSTWVAEDMENHPELYDVQDSLEPQDD